MIKFFNHLTHKKISKIAVTVVSLTLVNTTIYADLIYSVKAGFEQTNFLTESLDEARYDQYTDFNGALKLIDRRNESVFKLDSNFHQNLNGVGDNFVAVPEFFYSWLLSEQQTFTAGRKITEINKGEDLWGLGYFQPSMRLDSINPQAMGLTGFWWEASSNSFKFTAMASPFFLPDQGPNIREQDGQLVSNNPWFDSPVSQLRLASLESDIRYKIKWPQPEEIFNHNSVMLQMRWGLLKPYEDGTYLSLSGADKPLNQLSLGLTGTQKIGLSQENYTEAEINPMVTRHRVLSAEFGAQYGRVSGFVSGVYDTPYNIQQTMIVNTPVQSQSVVVGAEYMSDFGRFKSQHLLSGIKVWEQKSSQTNTDEDIELGSSVQEFDRFQFTDAVMWASRVRLSALEDQIGFRYIYAVQEQAGLLSLFADMSFDKNLKASINLDILGSSSDEDAGFISRHRENDRAKVSFTYAF